MRFLFIILLAVIVQAQTLINEKCENFRNFSIIHPDSIAYGWTDIGDSLRASDGSVREFQPTYSNHWPYYSTSEPESENRNYMAVDGVDPVPQWLSSPYVKGSYLPFFEADSTQWLYPYFDDGNFAPLADPDTLPYTMVFRDRRLLIDYTTSTYSYFFTHGRFADGWNAIYWAGDYDGAGSYQYVYRIYNSDDDATPGYLLSHVNDDALNVDTTNVPGGYQTQVLSWGTDSIRVYINGINITTDLRDNSRYFYPDPGSNYRPVFGASTTSGAAANFQDNWYHDMIFYKGVALNKQQVRAMELPTGWMCTGDFKPYRRATGPIDTTTTLTWELGFTSSPSADSAMYYTVTVPEKGDYLLSVDAYRESASGTLKIKFNNTVNSSALTATSQKYVYKFEDHAAGSDTLWIYGSGVSDSIVVDNIKLYEYGRFNKQNRHKRYNRY